MIIVNKFDIWKPGIFISPIKNSWYEVQIWAKNNTQINDIFITPADKWSHYLSDFLMFSQRSSVVTLGELFEIAFFPDYIDNWEERFEDVVPGAIAQFNGNFADNRIIVSNIYNKNTTDDFLRISHKYDAKYVIIEKPKRLDLPLVYENSDYLIYNLE